ncbi:hypothetical protein HanXRQr2_Chr08g0357321 [Helianthus annuus]|uniref:Uncharacterized protein n=1 Tax=Helianthus annuus TaxID=4232 RepID=A0A9K3IIA6_HELAN|nr:uncharacterized protein LOC110873861 isoform X2 [Helianthus annuus]KAF5796906.1 hypothetical protein HanXRQr2_Chr08g0357321 [Helianthus annuus]KAJ0548612.1 hypothetical protein HanIR_Chr08g0385721 [Helianthus annuus]KAJ0903091.1 hypothetical protein HanPSC8_Chr08g0345001 [Helianthus annuus]
MLEFRVFGQQKSKLVKPQLRLSVCSGHISVQVRVYDEQPNQRAAAAGVGSGGGSSWSKFGVYDEDRLYRSKSRSEPSSPEPYIYHNGDRFIIVSDDRSHSFIRFLNLYSCVILQGIANATTVLMMQGI